MYEKIIRAKLTFPDYLSADAKSLLSGVKLKNHFYFIIIIIFLIN